MNCKSGFLAAGLVAAVAFFSSPAAADETSRLRERLIAAGDASYQKLAREFEIVEAATGQTGNTTFQPAPGKSYFIYGLCDANCTNIDLELTDSNDRWWREADSRPDATPVVMIPKSDSVRDIYIALDMIACEAATCTMGIGIYAVEIE